MSTTRDPVRLSELDAAAESDLACAIRALRDEQGSSAMVEALEQRLARALGAEALAVVSAPRAYSGSSVNVVVLGLLASLFMPPSAANKTASAVTRSARSVTAAIAPRSTAPSPPMPAAVVAQPSPSPSAAEGRSHPRRRRVVGQPVSRSLAQQPALELELLQRSHTLLRRDPAGALQLAEQHAAAYPHGIFVQERELLAIEALLQQHKPSLAHARAQQFIERYAASPYALRVHELLEQR